MIDSGKNGWQELFTASCDSSVETLALVALPGTMKSCFGILALILAIPTTVLNSLIIVTIQQRKKLQTASNLLLLSLAVTDLCTGLLLLPSYAFLYLVRDPESHCGVINATTVVAFTTLLCTFCGMLMIATDRYLAIFHPYLYCRLTTSKSGIVKSIAVAFLLCLCIAVASMFTPHKLLYTIAVILLVVATLAWSIFVHIRSYMTSRNIRARDRRNSQLGNTEEIQSRNHRIGRMVSVILLALLFCFLPYLVGTVLLRIHRQWYFMRYFYPIVVLLLLLNSLLNPLIYCWKLNDVRVEMGKLLKTKNSVDAWTPSSTEDCNQVVSFSCPSSDGKM